MSDRPLLLSSVRTYSHIKIPHIWWILSIQVLFSRLLLLFHTLCSHSICHSNNKPFTVSISLHNFSTASTGLSSTFLHRAQTKLFARIGVTPLIFVHLLWTHFLQFMHKIKITIALFTHMPHGFVLLIVSPSDLLTTAWSSLG